MSAEDDKRYEDEWARTMANPDNMIVSDSLVGRLSDGIDEIQSETSDTYLQCSITSVDGGIISGRTASFQQSDDKSSVSFETTHSTANAMLRFGTLKDVIFSYPSGEEMEVVWSVGDNEKVQMKTEFFAQNDALITIVITTVKDDVDPNSYTITMEA